MPPIAGQWVGRRAVNQIADRYLEILRRTGLPTLTDAEQSALRDANNDVWQEPASTIRGSLWIGVEDSLPEGLAAKWGIDGPALVEKLRGLTYEQEVKLVEQTEAFWAAQ